MDGADWSQILSYTDGSANSTTNGTAAGATNGTAITGDDVTASGVTSSDGTNSTGSEAGSSRSDDKYYDYADPTAPQPSPGDTDSNTTASGNATDAGTGAGAAFVNGPPLPPGPMDGTNGTSEGDAGTLSGILPPPQVNTTLVFNASSSEVSNKPMVIIMPQATFPPGESEATTASDSTTSDTNATSWGTNSTTSDTNSTTSGTTNSSSSSQEPSYKRPSILNFDKWNTTEQAEAISKYAGLVWTNTQVGLVGW